MKTAYSQFAFFSLSVLLSVFWLTSCSDPSILEKKKAIEEFENIVATVMREIRLEPDVLTCLKPEAKFKRIVDESLFYHIWPTVGPQGGWLAYLEIPVRFLQGDKITDIYLHCDYFRPPGETFGLYLVIYRDHKDPEKASVNKVYEKDTLLYKWLNACSHEANEKLR